MLMILCNTMFYFDGYTKMHDNMTQNVYVNLHSQKMHGFKAFHDHLWKPVGLAELGFTLMQSNVCRCKLCHVMTAFYSFFT